MPRYIKLDDAIEIAKDYAKVRLQMHDWSGQAVAEDIAEGLRNLPAADVEEVKHGKWIDKGHFSLLCDKCEAYVAKGLLLNDQIYYCPRCGAKMDGKENEE